MNKTLMAVALSAACATGAWAWFGGKTQPVEAPVHTTTMNPVGTSQSGSSATAAAAPHDTPDEPTDPGVDPKAGQTAVPQSRQQAEDARMSSIVPGVWETNREGRRVLTVLTDGTATMDVTVEGAFSFVVGSRMTFNIKWQIVDGSLDFEMIDGKPESSVNAIISLYGKKRVQKILEFASDKFVLKDNDGDDDHVWSRIEKPAPHE